MKDKHFYTITRTEFIDRVVSLIDKIKDNANIVALTFFGASTDENYQSELEQIKKEVYLRYTKRLLLITYVPQPLFDKESMAMEVYQYDDNKISDLLINELNGVKYILHQRKNETLLIVEGIVSSDFKMSVKNQSEEVLQKLSQILKKNRLSPSNIIRQWNYIGNITEIKNGVQNYQAFNDARSEFYEKDKWNNGYPAATGIGTSCSGIIVSAIVYNNESCNNDVNNTFSIYNPLQIPAHNYSKDVLIDEVNKRLKSTTPKFERAKLLCYDNKKFCFISGTAAIRGEKSMLTDDAALQTSQTLENIEYLISKDNLIKHDAPKILLKCNSLRVYIKRLSDFESVQELLRKRIPEIPVVLLHADICRDELLVEIEGIANNALK